MAAQRNGANLKDFAEIASPINSESLPIDLGRRSGGFPTPRHRYVRNRVQGVGAVPIGTTRPRPID